MYGILLPVRDGKTNTITIYHEDYLRLLERKATQKGMTLQGIIHQAIMASEPQPRNDKGQFQTKKAVDEKT